MHYLDAFMSGEGDLRVLTACPFCNTNYSIRAARVIAKRDDAHVVYIACRHCGGSIIALIVSGGVDAAQSVGVITDLAPEEVSRFSQGRTVSADDALAMHAFLSAPDAPHQLFSIPTATTTV